MPISVQSVAVSVGCDGVLGLEVPSQMPAERGLPWSVVAVDAVVVLLRPREDGAVLLICGD